MSEHLTQPERIAKLEVELGDAEDRIERLRARVAKLEAALKSIRYDAEGGQCEADIIGIIDAVLMDAPQ